MLMRVHRQDAGDCGAGVPPRERPRGRAAQPAAVVRGELSVHAGRRRDPQARDKQTCTLQSNSTAMVWRALFA